MQHWRSPMVAGESSSLPMAMHGIGNNAGEHAKRGSGNVRDPCGNVFGGRFQPVRCWKMCNGRFALMGSHDICKLCVFIWVSEEYEKHGHASAWSEKEWCIVMHGFLRI